jgi:hypothetical protein
VPAPAGDKIILDKPEFTETSRTSATTLKQVAHAAPQAVVVQEVVPNRVATGTRPTLRELDQLKLAGYQKLVCLDREPPPEADQRIFAARSFEVAHGTAAAVRALTGPDAVFVYAGDPAALRAWWVAYFRDVEHLSADAARIRADRLLK